MLKASKLSERLRLTLYPVPRWVEIVHHELDLTEPMARALLDALEAAGKVVTFTDTDGIPRVAHAENWRPPTGERKA